jgi:hypothetical protein
MIGGLAEKLRDDGMPKLRSESALSHAGPFCSLQDLSPRLTLSAQVCNRKGSLQTFLITALRFWPSQPTIPSPIFISASGTDLSYHLGWALPKVALEFAAELRGAFISHLVSRDVSFQVLLHD